MNFAAIFGVTEDPFTFFGSLWILWFLVGICLVGFELISKREIGSFSIAAFITIFSSFFATLSSQVLVFIFVTAFIFVTGHVHREHHGRLRQRCLR